MVSVVRDIVLTGCVWCHADNMNVARFDMYHIHQKVHVERRIWMEAVFARDSNSVAESLFAPMDSNVVCDERAADDFVTPTTLRSEHDTLVRWRPRSHAATSATPAGAASSRADYHMPSHPLPDPIHPAPMTKTYRQRDCR